MGRSNSGDTEQQLLGGVRPVLEALQGGRAITKILVARERGGTTQRIEQAARVAGVPVKVVPREALDRRAGGRLKHQGVLAELEEARVELLDLEGLLDRIDGSEVPLLVLLDGVQDPGNLGAIIRSAYALGADGLILPQDRSAPLGPTAIKASAGTALHLPVAKVVNLKHALEPLAERGFWTGAAVMDGDPATQCDLTRPFALIMGGEERGVRPTLARRCDFRMTIPMRQEADSLNVSVATGILLYEIKRQRQLNLLTDAGVIPTNRTPPTGRSLA